MPPQEDTQRISEQSGTIHRVYPGWNDLYFWLYAEVTHANGTRTLEILLPRTPVEQFSTKQREQLKAALASTDAPSPSKSPPQPPVPVRGSRHLVPASL